LIGLDVDDGDGLRKILEVVLGEERFESGFVRNEECFGDVNSYLRIRIRGPERLDISESACDAVMETGIDEMVAMRIESEGGKIWVAYFHFITLTPAENASEFGDGNDSFVAGSEKRVRSDDETTIFVNGVEKLMIFLDIFFRSRRGVREIPWNRVDGGMVKRFGLDESERNSNEVETGIENERGSRREIVDDFVDVA